MAPKKATKKLNRAKALQHAKPLTKPIRANRPNICEVSIGCCPFGRELGR